MNIIQECGHKSSQPNLLIIKIRLHWPKIIVKNLYVETWDEKYFIEIPPIPQFDY